MLTCWHLISGALAFGTRANEQPSRVERDGEPDEDREHARVSGISRQPVRHAGDDSRCRFVVSTRVPARRNIVMAPSASPNASTATPTDWTYSGKKGKEIYRSATRPPRIARLKANGGRTTAFDPW